MEWWMIILAITYFFIGGCGGYIFLGTTDGNGHSKLSLIVLATTIFFLWPLWVVLILGLAILDDLGFIK